MTTATPTIEAAAHDLGDLVIGEVLCSPCQAAARRDRPALDALLAEWLRKHTPPDDVRFRVRVDDRMTPAVQVADTLLEELRHHAGLRDGRAGDERKVSTLTTAVLLVLGWALGMATAAATVGLK